MHSQSDLILSAFFIRAQDFSLCRLQIHQSRTWYDSPVLPGSGQPACWRRRGRSKISAAYLWENDSSDPVFSQDIPPYIIAGKFPVKYCGLNLIGLRRRGFSNELIEHIHSAYRLLYSKGIISEGINEIKNNLQITPEIQYIIDFVETSKRGIIR